MRRKNVLGSDALRQSYQRYSDQNVMALAYLATLTLNTSHLHVITHFSISHYYNHPLIKFHNCYYICRNRAVTPILVFLILCGNRINHTALTSSRA